MDKIDWGYTIFVGLLLIGGAWLAAAAFEWTGSKSRRDWSLNGWTA
jgi:hypothetical protein